MPAPVPLDIESIHKEARPDPPQPDFHAVGAAVPLPAIHRRRGFSRPSDRRWIAFHVQSEAGGATLYVAPLEGAPPPNRAGYQSPAHRAGTSIRSGRRTEACCTSSRIATASTVSGRRRGRSLSGRPLGLPREILHMHTAARSLANLYMGGWGLCSPATAWSSPWVEDRQPLEAGALSVNLRHQSNLLEVRP